MAILTATQLTKHYKKVKAVEQLDLAIEQGSVYGFLGLNGAGKTTTLRMITGLARPTSGRVTVCGEDVKFGSSGTNRHIGYLPDVPEFYSFMQPQEYLMLCGRLYGLENASIKKRSDELLTLVGLADTRRSIGGFSRGMKQRLGIAQALIHDPEILILDEPTSALDPVGRKEVLEIIAELKGRLTVLFSTHILSDVERVCDAVGIMHGGRLALSGCLDDLLNKYTSKTLLLEAGKNNTELRERLAQLPYVKEVVEKEGKLLISCSDAEKLELAICPMLTELGLPISHFERVESKLEDVFIEVIQGE